MNDTLKSHFLNLYSLALSDTQITPEELTFLYHFGEERGVPSNSIDEILLNPHNVSFQVPESIDLRIEYLYDFVRMILVDDKILPDEVLSFKKFALRFGFIDENIDSIFNYLIECAKSGKELKVIIEEAGV